MGDSRSPSRQSLNQGWQYVTCILLLSLFVLVVHTFYQSEHFPASLGSTLSTFLISALQGPLALDQLEPTATMS